MTSELRIETDLVHCHTEGGGNVTRRELLDLVGRIPDEKLPEAEAMLRKLLEDRPPFKPTPLGGLWKGVNITESDIAEARKEMWGNFGERLRV